jgi:hypothetical protein
LTAAAGAAITGLARRARNSEADGISADETAASHAADKDVSSAEKA